MSGDRDIILLFMSAVDKEGLLLSECTSYCHYRNRTNLLTKCGWMCHSERRVATSVFLWPHLSVPLKMSVYELFINGNSQKCCVSQRGKLSHAREHVLKDRLLCSICVRTEHMEWIGSNITLKQKVPSSWLKDTVKSFNSSLEAVVLCAPYTNKIGQCYIPLVWVVD